MPPSGQGLWFFLLTGPHTGPIPGLFRAGRAAMAEELGWSLEAFDKAFGELIDKGMVRFDPKARLVWLPNALKHNKPESPNVVRSWKGEFDLLPECELRTEAVAAMRPVVSVVGPGFAAAFGEVFDGGGKGKPKASGKAKANQEQEQEQEQQGRYPREFEEAWDAYPARPGASKVTAFKAWQARINTDCDPAEMLEGTKRYAQYVLAAKTEPQFIKQPATFFGPGMHFQADWSVPAGKASPHKLAGQDYSTGLGDDGWFEK